MSLAQTKQGAYSCKKGVLAPLTVQSRCSRSDSRQYLYHRASSYFQRTEENDRALHNAVLGYKEPIA